jgi:soluble lytic murein transglycosylase
MMPPKRDAMRRFIGIVYLLALPAWAQSGHPEDAAFQAAREAFVKGERAKLVRAQSALSTHPLVPWVEYFRLNLALEDGTDAGVAEFIAHHEGNYLAEKLRGDWLRWLMRQQDWPTARQQFDRLRQPDAEAHCRGLEIRLQQEEPGAVGDAHAVLAAGTPLAEACQAPLARLARNSAIPADLLWQRLRQQLAQGRLKEARLITGWLPAQEAIAWRSVEAVMAHPARHVAKLPERFAASRSERELAMFAVIRMARADARVAAARWQEIEGRFAGAERGFVWGWLALQAARSHYPEALAWFDQAVAAGAALDDEQQAWHIRSALRAQHWPAVARTIAALPETRAALPEWVYWRARAHAAAGAHDLARADFGRIAGQPNFYGILAGEALGYPFRPPPPAALHPDELAWAAAHPGLARGLALIRAGIRIEGIREWNWALQGAGDRRLLAAAELARRHDVIDRAINTADRTRYEHDFALRYPTPFLDQVAPRTREVGLDPAWVYGLMRQESRFITDAKSSAGAKGLMQLMPATAKWVAGKIGMKHYHPAKVTEMDINVTLGTSYMKMVLDSLDDHPLLASAAYNAGPGRARKWRGDVPLEGAIYAETIPFSETRDYVKKVMANAVNYAVLMGEPAPLLAARLGTVQPRRFGDGTAEDLP